MLDNYFGAGSGATREERQRLAAVQAALEILVAGISVNTNGRDFDRDLQSVAQNIGPLADIIQDAIENKK